MGLDVTGLQVITNLYPAEIRFTNTEHSGNNRTIGSSTTEGVSNAWIPWCDNKEQFPGHHMRIESANLNLYVWQTGPKIRYSRDGWSANAPEIPGNSGINQSVAWTLDSNGQITQSRYE